MELPKSSVDLITGRDIVRSWKLQNPVPKATKRGTCTDVRGTTAGSTMHETLAWIIIKLARAVELTEVEVTDNSILLSLQGVNSGTRTFHRINHT